MKYVAGVKYQLVDELIIPTRMWGFGDIVHDFIVLKDNGLLFLLDGFPSDGPSGPCPDLKELMPAAFVHDAFYRLMRAGLLPPECKKIADEEFKRMAEEDGAGDLVSRIVFESVEHFGYSSCRRRDREILTANCHREGRV